jgi:hypothetical protein
MGGSRSSPVFAFALLYFAFVLCGEANGVSPTSPFANAPPLMVKDVPFEQTTSKIFVFASSASASNNDNRDEIEISSAASAKINVNLPTGWDRLPFDAAFQVVSRPTGTGPASSFLILTRTQGAWTLDLPARGGVDGKASFTRVDAQLGLKVDATMRATFHPTSRGISLPSTTPVFILHLCQIRENA